MDLSIPPPVTGRHRFEFCQSQYHSIHAFLASRKWAEAKDVQGIGGTTWIELFALYDTCGDRHEDARHVKDRKAEERVKQRSSKVKKEVRNASKKRKKGSAVVLPCLNE